MSAGRWSNERQALKRLTPRGPAAKITICPRVLSPGRDCLCGKCATPERVRAARGKVIDRLVRMRVVADQLAAPFHNLEEQLRRSTKAIGEALRRSQRAVHSDAPLQMGDLCAVDADGAIRRAGAGDEVVGIFGVGGFISQTASTASSGVAATCESCEGSGTVDMTLGGEPTADPCAPCPDCEGEGVVTL